MRTSPARILVFLLGAALAGALAACETLPKTAYVSKDTLRQLNPGAGGDETAAASAGKNEVGEQCQYAPGRADDTGIATSAAFSVFCGEWSQPSGRIFEVKTGGGTGMGVLESLAASSDWRSYLDQRFRCESTSQTSLLGDVPAVALQCVRRLGGWPHLALAVTISGKVYLADGVITALPALEATLAALDGRPAPSGNSHSAAYDLLAKKFASRPFGSGDLNAYYSLMRLGDEANKVERFADAEYNFRDALAVQERILGPTDPSLATTLMKLANQIDNQGRSTEAEGLLERAGELARANPDQLIAAELIFYRAAHAASQRKRDEALTLVAAAERSYEALLPPAVREAAKQAPQSGVSQANAAFREALGLGNQLYVNPATRAAVYGLAETRRLKATVYNRMGRYEESQKMADEARALLENNGLNPPGVMPRVLRISALSQAGEGNTSRAEANLARSARLFSEATPNEKPLAVTLFELGRVLHEDGRDGEAIEKFREGRRILGERGVGIVNALVGPYLEALHAEAERRPAERDALLREMFEATQLEQSGVTAKFIAKSAARLATTNAEASTALRKLQEVELEVNNLFGVRDAEAKKPEKERNAEDIAALDKQIAEATQKKHEIEEAVLDAIPAYNQLIQASAPAKTVAELLRPEEAFVAIHLGEKRSWGFLVVGSTFRVYEIRATIGEVQKMVERLRVTAQVNWDNDEPELRPFDLAVSYKLYRALFGEIEAELKKQQDLVIAANGPLLSFPFAALATAEVPSVGGDHFAAYKTVPWMLRTHALSYVPTAQSFLALRKVKAASAAPRAFAGFADFRPASPRQIAAAFPGDRCVDDANLMGSLLELPGTRAEAATIAARFGYEKSTIVMGDRFTRDTVQQMDLAQYRVVLFATHAFLPTEIRCVSEPSLLLSVPRDAADANAGFLLSRDILKLKLDADLVVLSACNTAGPDGRSAGESLSGLARAFFFAGSRGVLATHWSVSDVAAQRIIPDTTTAPALSSPRALRAAQLALLDAAGGSETAIEFAHPFAWAPFVLIGDGVRAAGPLVSRAPAAAPSFN